MEAYIAVLFQPEQEYYEIIDVFSTIEQLEDEVDTTDDCVQIHGPFQVQDNPPSIYDN